MQKIKVKEVINKLEKDYGWMINTDKSSLEYDLIKIFVV